MALELEHLLTLNSEEPEIIQMKNIKGIILAAGSGARLYPITMGISNQLLPVYDKPMIYYPLSVIMLAGIREIAIITTPEDQAQFQRLLGDGNQWGLSFAWITQNKPEGLAQAYFLAESFLDGRAPEFASQVQPSSRGELEITELLEHYRADSTLHVEKMGRGFAWLDTGIHASLLDAGNFVRTLTERQGLQVGSPDEIAFQKGWITEKEFRGSFQKFLKNDYGMYLQSMLQD